MVAVSRFSECWFSVWKSKLILLYEIPIPGQSEIFTNRRIIRTSKFVEFGFPSPISNPFFSPNDDLSAFRPNERKENQRSNHESLPPLFAPSPPSSRLPSVPIAPFSQLFLSRLLFSNLRPSKCCSSNRINSLLTFIDCSWIKLERTMIDEFELATCSLFGADSYTFSSFDGHSSFKRTGPRSLRSMVSGFVFLNQRKESDLGAGGGFKLSW